VSLYEFIYDPAKQLINTPQISWNGDTSGGGLFITSNGQNNGILWAFSHSGKLYAFDAANPISNGPIWQAGVPGPASWGWPTVTNGKAFVPAGNGQIYAFGLH